MTPSFGVRIPVVVVCVPVSALVWPSRQKFLRTGPGALRNVYYTVIGAPLVVALSVLPTTGLRGDRCRASAIGVRFPMVTRRLAPSRLIYRL